MANRVQLIRRPSSPQQWRYIDTSQNPADLATRRLSAPDLTGSDWITGPSFLRSQINVLPKEEGEIPLDVHDPEVRKEVLAHTTNIRERRGLGAERFSRFSSLASLQRAIAKLIVMVKEFLHRKSKPQDRKELMTVSLNNRPRSPTVLEQQQAIVVIIRAAQGEAFREELRLQHRAHTITEENHRECNRERKHNLKNSALYRLDPFIDGDGLLRVGGRLRRSHLGYGEKHPVLIPKGHHLAKLIVRHYHNQVHHQGRQITHGTIRQAGYWLVHGSHTVSRELSSCVVCKSCADPL